MKHYWGLLAIVLVDQLSKWYMREYFSVVWNQRGGFGLLVGVWLYIVYEWIKEGQGIKKWAKGFIVAGGLSNLIDRVVFGAVRDFIYYPVVSIYGNIADIFLVLGVLILIVKRKT